MAPKLVIILPTTSVQLAAGCWDCGCAAAFGEDEAPLNRAIAGTQMASAISAARVSAPAKVLVLFMISSMDPKKQRSLAGLGHGVPPETVPYPKNRRNLATLVVLRRERSTSLGHAPLKPRVLIIRHPPARRESRGSSRWSRCTGPPHVPPN